MASLTDEVRHDYAQQLSVKVQECDALQGKVGRVVQNIFVGGNLEQYDGAWLRDYVGQSNIGTGGTAEATACSS